MLRRSILLGLAALPVALTACKTTEPMRFSQETEGLTLDQMKRAIILAGTKRGWQMTSVGRNKIRGIYKKGRHVAIVNIPYTADSYQILPDSQSTLMTPDGKVDRHFNTWMKNLDMDIQGQIAQLKIK